MSFRSCWLAPIGLLVACAEHGPAPARGAGGPSRGDVAASASTATPPSQTALDKRGSEHAECQRKIAEALSEPALGGAPTFEERRFQILGRAKAEPVLFRRAPESAREPSAEVKGLRLRLSTSPAPGYTLATLYKHLRNRPDVARELLLSEGYLYSESPGLAAAFVDLVELHHLFDAPEIVIERGAQRLRAKKGTSFWYEYVDGPERGQRARVLLLDRVWPAGEDPGPPLHVELRSLALATGFERLEVQRITERKVVGRLRYGAEWVPALMSIDGARLTLECEAIPPERSDVVGRARELARRRRAVLAKLQETIVTMVGEALPFDEPRTEEGQQDGNLRPAWRWAYTHGWDSYTFNDDTYLVFDARGRPKVPQVCIDFITDTIERASGTWWAERDSERRRARGGIDFDEVGIENRRSVDVFIRFAQQHPEWFDSYGLAEEERVRFIERDAFFQHLSQHADRYAPGDIVAIHGPRSDGENHWHSFYVYDADPITGIPIYLASNAGKPRVRSWEGEMRAAPRRSIHTRIRPRLHWLERTLGLPGKDVELKPASLISAPI